MIHTPTGEIMTAENSRLHIIITISSILLVAGTLAYVLLLP